MSRGTTQPKPPTIETAFPAPDHSGEGLLTTELPQETIGYIAALCTELSAMARMAGKRDLAYFLEMARIEAATLMVRNEEKLDATAPKG